MNAATKRQLSLLKSLRAAKGRRDAGLFLVEGVRLCEELAASSLRPDLVLVTSAAAANPSVRHLVRKFAQQNVDVLTARDDHVQSVSDTVHSQGIVAAAQWQDVAVDDLQITRDTTVLALDGVSDPGNVGTVIRTAAWCGADAVLLGCGCADLLNPKTVRSTMGALFSLPVCRQVALPAALCALKPKGFSVTVTATTGDPSWRDWRAGGRSVLVLGSEARGISEDVRDLADRTVCIPGKGKGESLNVAVAAGMFLSVLV